jgi:ribosomal protein S10
MLKKGTMRIGETVYTLYELKTENYYRFDILKEDGDFHMDVDFILFSCYKFKNRKIYGDRRLYQRYIDTVTFLKKMHGETTSESKWEYGHYIRTVQKGNIGSRLITRTRDAQWDSEAFEHGSVTIIMRMYIDDYKLAMIPINNRQYTRG